MKARLAVIFVFLVAGLSVWFSLSGQKLTGFVLPGKVYLPGVLNLVPAGQNVLGWESELIRPTEIIDYANKEREKAGVPILHPDERLMKAAQMRAEVMLRTKHVDHQDPYEGLNMAAVLPKVGYNFLYASENIALAQGDAKGIIAGFMNSPNHKVNLLDKNLIETGVGVVVGQMGPNYVVVVDHLFGVPVNQEAYKGYKAINFSGFDGAVKEIEGTMVEMADEKSRTILSRQVEILSLLKQSQDPGKAYTQIEYDLVDEYVKNLLELEQTGK